MIIVTHGGTRERHSRTPLQLPQNTQRAEVRGRRSRVSQPYPCGGCCSPRKPPQRARDVPPWQEDDDDDYASHHGQVLFPSAGYSYEHTSFPPGVWGRKMSVLCLLGLLSFNCCFYFRLVAVESVYLFMNFIMISSAKCLQKISSTLNFNENIINIMVSYQPE